MSFQFIARQIHIEFVFGLKADSSWLIADS
jgi:hypothetical protein